MVITGPQALEVTDTSIEVRYRVEYTSCTDGRSVLYRDGAPVFTVDTMTSVWQTTEDFGLDEGTQYAYEVIGLANTDTVTEASGDVSMTTLCGLGKENTVPCTPCAIGYFKDTVSGVCQQCLGDHHSTVSTGTEQNSECECDFGYYYDYSLFPLQDPFCNECDPDWYKDTVSFATICTPCPVGSSTLGAPASTTIDACVCPAGEQPIGGDIANGCEACPQNRYKDSPGNDPCTVCPGLRQTPGLGADSFDECQCPPGYYSNGTCDPCPRGSYKPGLNNLPNCTSCPGNFTTRPDTAATNVTECDDCLPFHYGASCAGCPGCVYTCDDGINGLGLCQCANNSGWSGPLCDTCTGDYFGPGCNLTCTCLHGTCDNGVAGTGLCTGDCDAGWVGANCDTCAPGHTGASCELCHPGHGGTACVACTKGTASGGGHRLSTICEVCAPGRHAPGGTADTCEECAMGTFQDEYESFFCYACGVGNSSTSGATTGDACFACAIGTYKPGDAEGTCEPCPGIMTTARVSTGSVLECGCPPGTGLTSATGTECVACTRGSRQPLVARDTCRACEEGSLWVGADAECIGCPYGGYCAGGDAPAIPDDGYASSADVFVACLPPEACMRGGVCRTGHTGEFCQICRPGYTKDPGTGLCVECPPSVPFVFAGLFLAGLVAAVLLVKLARRNTAFFTALSVGFNFLQVIAVLSSFDLEWPGYVQTFFMCLAAANFDLALFKPECMVSDPSRAYHVIWALKMALPLIMCGILGTGFLLLAGYQRAGLWKRFGALPTLSRYSLAAYKYAVTNATITMLFVLYLTVTATAMEVFPCVRSDDGSYRMRREPAIRCYEGAWYRQMAISVVVLVMYSICVPVTVAFVLFRRRENLWKRKNLARFGLLYLRFRPEMFMYEIVAVISRKFGVIFGKVIFPKQPRGQVSVALVVVVLAALLHFRLLPYATIHINRLESVMLSCAFVVLTLALVFAVSGDSLSDAASHTLAISLITLISIAILVVLVAVALEIRKTYRLQKHGIRGRYAVDKLDVWSSFFSRKVMLTEHTQHSTVDGIPVVPDTKTPGATSVHDLGDRCEHSIVMHLTTGEPMQLLVQLTHQSRFRRRADVGWSWRSIGGWCSRRQPLPAGDPILQASEASASGLSHTVRMHAPASGYYTCRIVGIPEAMDPAQAAAIADFPSLGGGSNASHTTGCGTSRAAACLRGEHMDLGPEVPEITDALAHQGAVNLIRFRLTASTEWTARDAVTGLDRDSQFFTTIDGLTSDDTIGGSPDAQLDTQLDTFNTFNTLNTFDSAVYLTDDAQTNDLDSGSDGEFRAPAPVNVLAAPSLDPIPE